MGLFYFNKERLVYEKVPFKTYIKGIGVVGVVFALGWISSTNEIINKIIHINQVDTTIVTQSKPFSEEALIELLKDCNMKYPYIVLAQAKIESGHFKSKVFKQNHNMFGMRKARQRITTSQSEKNTYAFYRDWMDCVYDYAMYQSTVMCAVSNEDEYFARLGERYAEDPNYVAVLKQVIKKEKLKSIFEE